jgi:hypothetical protein
VIAEVFCEIDDGRVVQREFAIDGIELVECVSDLNPTSQSYPGSVVKRETDDLIDGTFFGTCKVSLCVKCVLFEKEAAFVSRVEKVIVADMPCSTCQHALTM